MGQQGILGCAYKAFYLELLFNAFKKEFYLPSFFVNLGYRLGRPGEVIGKDRYDLAGLGVFLADAAQPIRILLARIEAF